MNKCKVIKVSPMERPYTIDIDLDDGVTVNYRKVQTGADGKFCEILANSKDIMAKEK